MVSRALRSRAQRKIVVIVEGGAQGSLGAECRRAFKALFQRLKIKRHAADSYPATPEIIAAGPRHLAYKTFYNKLKRPDPDTVYLLLVDSESSVQLGESKWLHLLNREGDKWPKPDGADEDDVFLMAQAMESWLIADPDVLASYYGQGFDANKLPRHHDVEAIDKDQLNPSLARATELTKKGAYSKGAHSFDLLGCVDPDKIAARCPHAQQLFARLRFLFER